MGGLIELADTSAWTNHLKDAAASAAFGELLTRGRIATCEIVVLELLRSSRDIDSFRLRRHDLSQLPLVPIDTTVWSRATDVFEELAARGPLHHRQVPLPDLVVAAAAEVAGLRVVHYDRDFDVIAEVTGQPVRAIAPLGSLP